MRWWDSDGPAGPLPPWLVVAGNFTLAGDVRTNNIAAWDGARWHALAQGVGTPSESIFALEEFQGQLYASGILSTASGVPVRGIARFDGAQWSNPAGGLWLSPVGARVYALQTIGNTLYAGGLIADAGGTSVTNVARFDGAGWQPMDLGLDGAVYALHEHNGQLHAAGAFSDSGNVHICPRVARWNGAHWEAPAPGTSGLAGSGAIAYALASHDGALVVGGALPGVSHLARIENSEWRSLANGVSGGSSISVRSLVSSGSRLLVGGNFEAAGGLPAAGLAAIEANAWQLLGGGTDGTVLALEADGQGRVFAAGSFVDAIGGVPVGRIGVWNGTVWQPVGVGFTDSVLAQTTYENNAIIAGSFRHAGSSAANAIVQWDGAVWSPLGSGLTNGAVAAGEARALSVDPSSRTLIAGGSFSLAGGQSASNIARWDGSSWQAIGAGTNAPVFALAMHDGAIIAGGSFTSAGGTSSARIARFAGGAWQPMGAGFSGTGSVNVRALAIYNNELYAGGFFAFSGSTPVAGIARWTGTSWQSVGTGVSGATPQTSGVLAMTVYQGELVVGGTFANAGGASDTQALAKWNGTRWARVGPELYGSTPTQVNALTVRDDKLVVGGLFAFAGSRPLNNLAFYSPETGWVSMGDAQGQGLGGLTSLAAPKSLHAFAGEVLVGGDFSNQGSFDPVLQTTPPGTPVRAFWTRFSTTGTPWSTARVLSENPLLCGSTASLSARLATGYGATPATSWQWLRDGQPLAESSRITGVTTPTLTISGSLEGDSGLYSCVATTACGQASLAKPVALRVACAAACDDIDFNNDELFPDDADLIAFLQVLAGEACATCNDIDFNNDGLFPDDSDLVDFLRVLAGGQC
jgi:hypothetical protein